MSLETWKTEFYPCEADDVMEDQAISHSLRKWQGLTPKNLAKHDLTVDDAAIMDESGNELDIAANSCALCANYFEDVDPDYDEDGEEPHCQHCPLYAARGGVQCDNEMPNEETAPYQLFTRDNNPTAMIHWLKRTLKENEHERNDPRVVAGS